MTYAVDRQAPISSAKVHLSQSIGVLRLSMRRHVPRYRPKLPRHRPLIVETPISTMQSCRIEWLR